MKTFKDIIQETCKNDITEKSDDEAYVLTTVNRKLKEYIKKNKLKTKDEIANALSKNMKKWVSDIVDDIKS